MKDSNKPPRKAPAKTKEPKKQLQFNLMDSGSEDENVPISMPKSTRKTRSTKKAVTIPHLETRNE